MQHKFLQETDTHYTIKLRKTEYFPSKNLQVFVKQQVLKEKRQGPKIANIYLS